MRVRRLIKEAGIGRKMAWHARWGHLFLKAVTPADFFPN
jgi:hypothetical protein